MEKYLDKNAEVEDRVTDLLEKLTLDEKISLLSGKTMFTATPVERLKIPAFKMTDGPIGVAMHSSSKGKRTRFPATIGLAATWNKELAFQMGKAIGKEVKLANWKVT